MTFIEPATLSFDAQTEGSTVTTFMPAKTIRRMPALSESQPQKSITSAELFALQRGFDRFINELNPPRTRKI